MPKIKCILSYDGTFFSGFQIQPARRTVQGELEKALLTIHKGDHVRIQASGRTDTGVHAEKQTIHFETPYTLPEANWKRALNTLLPADIYIKEVQKVPQTFHSRYDALEKKYKYIVLNTVEPDVFRRNNVYHCKDQLDIERMQAACQYLEGTHDFTTFTSAKAEVKGSKVRTLYEVTCVKKGHEVIFTFRGDGFLYHMVRILVGVLLDIGRRKREVQDIPHLLAARDRRLASYTAPPQGLYLWDVKYK